MILNVADLYLSFGRTAVLQGFGFDLEAGEIACLLGHSGCGKTTALRAVAGFEQPERGRIALQERTLSDGRLFVPPHLRRIGMVFQDYALFPHLNVADNIAFGLSGHSAEARKARVAELLSLIGLPDYGGHYPHQLSGGQQQRVALARSLAKGPKLLLLDEPMGALDKKLRSRMQLELVNIIETSGVTCVMVTHDQEEAMTMATRIALMDQGWIQQVGTPDEIYEQPANRFAAEFIGSVNLVDATIDEDEPDYVTLKTPAFEAPIHIGHGITGFPGQAVSFAVRPEKLDIAKAEPAQPHNKARGTIEDIAYFGSHSVYHVRLPSGIKLLVNFANEKRWESEGMTWGDPVWLWWGDNDGVVLTS